MQTLINMLADCLVLANAGIGQLRRQNLHAGLRKLQILSQKLTDVTKEILAESGEFLQWGMDVASIPSMLSGILSAQESEDYILVADLLELQLVPWLLQSQAVLLENHRDLPDGERYLCNLEGIRRRDAVLADRIAELEAGENYVLEPTSSGHFTMQVTDSTGTYYFHSNANPVAEGEIFAEQYYSIDESRYLVFGLGLGYHIKALCELDDGICVDIIEPDLAIIKAACQVMNLSWLYDNPGIHLLYDRDYLQLADHLENSSAIIIHYPSLRHVADPGMKLQLEKVFIRDSGQRNMRIQFANNFRDNIVNCTEYVDVLEGEFYQKNVVIVAAGPSLDKNVEGLRKKPSGTIVLAVGTVFRKLVDMGILPDYVIFLDAQPHLYRQIAGLENQRIPIICASTACKKIPAAYQGRKYLICQRGYDRAENYAGERGYRLYETGGSVSTIALDMCLQLGCRSVAYMGLDLAFTGNLSHARNTADYGITDEKDKIRVPAVGGGTLPASRLFVIYREWIEHRLEKEEAMVIDATEGGALKKGMKIMTLQETFAMWAE